MSHLLEILSLGLILSADAFSAAVAMGSRRFLLRDLLTFAFASAGAAALSALAGFIAGSRIISLISGYDHWIAFGLLLAVALHMFYEGFEGLRGKIKEESAAFIVSQKFSSSRLRRAWTPWVLELALESQKNRFGLLWGRLGFVGLPPLSLAFF